ncbi:MAG: DUF1295 domain-containing protein [Clostridia bacterium]|nr:DUF1295 domain-containing protein [Clostridia bacterium]
MKKGLGIACAVLICLSVIVFGFLNGISLSGQQWHTLKVTGIIAICSAAYCFVVGEISRNNSQMDKLWSLLPIAYTWVIAWMGGFRARLVIMACLVTLWGIRLTYNFAKKGAYKIRFWEGEEDYRWAVLRGKDPFRNKIVWAFFDLFFISIYQNFLVWLISIPGIWMMDSDAPFGVLDIVCIVLTLAFLVLETVADLQQWRFQQKKKDLLNAGTPLDSMEYPYNKGFNTTGLWNRFRHPNYLGEQGFWIAIYLFSLGCGINHYVFFNPSVLGCMLLVLLFLGSSTLGESISSSKYPEYAEYQKTVFKYLPIRKYRND